MRSEEILADFLRKSKETTFATYQTLIKGFAFAGLYGKACYMYTEIKVLGMEPDIVSTAGIMMESHEVDDQSRVGSLSRPAGQPFSQVPFEDPTTLVCRVACAHLCGWPAEDIYRAVSMFHPWQQMQPSLVRPMAFNIEMMPLLRHARKLVQEMRQAQYCNSVTFDRKLAGMSNHRSLRGF